MNLLKIAAALALLLQAACSPAVEQQAPAPAREDAPTTATAGTYEFPAPPKVPLADQPEVERMLRTHGADLLVVNFWSTTCGPCLKEMPDFEALHRKYRDRGVRFVGLSTDADIFDDWEQRVSRKLQDLDVTYANMCLDVDPMEFIPFFSKDWGGAQPATFYYDGEGRKLGERLGALTREELEADLLRHAPGLAGQAPG